VYQPLATFLFYQGVRLKETLNITWGQVDFETGEYRPSKATKTKDTSPKPLKDTVLAMLKKMKGNHAHSDYVFADARSDGDNVGKRFEGAFRNAMLEMKPVSGFGENRGLAGTAWRCSWCQTVYRNIPAPEPDDEFSPVCPSDKDKCKRDRVPLQYHYVGPSPHSLRASCAVYYLEKGLPDSAVQRITGHKNAKVFHGYCRFRTSSIAGMMNTPDKGKR
jgi:integrase